MGASVHPRPSLMITYTGPPPCVCSHDSLKSLGPRKAPAEATVQILQDGTIATSDRPTPYPPSRRGAGAEAPSPPRRLLLKSRFLLTEKKVDEGVTAAREAATDTTSARPRHNSSWEAPRRPLRRRQGTRSRRSTRSSSLNPKAVEKGAHLPRRPSSESRQGRGFQTAFAAVRGRERSAQGGAKQHGTALAEWWRMA